MKYKMVSMHSYNLHMIKTDNFKRVFINVNFRRPIEKYDITNRNLLSDILLESNSKYKDNRSLAIAAENNYDLIVKTITTRLGNYINSAFQMVALNEKYSESGSFLKSFKFFMDVLFQPNVCCNKFNDESFEIVKKALESQIKSLKDDKRKYSIIRMLEIMDSNSPISLRGVGYLEDLDSITPKSLYEYYVSMLNKDLIDVFVLGDIDFDEITKLFNSYFMIKTIKKPKSDLICKHSSFRSIPQKLIEYDDVTQAKLTIGCKLNKLTDFESKYVMVIYNMLLGEGCDSKFFKDIREKKSLCYYVNSSYTRIDNLLTITSGINRNKLNEMIDSIKLSMKQMTKGDFTIDEVEIAKNNVLTSLDSIFDSPSRIMNTYYSSYITGLDDIETRRKQYQRVTKEDIMKVGKKIKIDTIYLLSGGGCNGKN